MRSKARSSLSWLLSLLMVFTMMPAMWMTAYAESESSVAPTVTMSEVTEGTYTYGDAGATVTITATFSNSTDYDTGKNGSVVKLELFKNDANTQVSNGCIASGSMAAAREKGLVRSEGKEYVMQDGDVVLFKFNV